MIGLNEICRQASGIEACRQAGARGLRGFSGRQGDLIVAAGSIHGGEERGAAASRHGECLLSPLLQVGRMPQGYLTARLALQHHETELAAGVRLEFRDAAVAGLGASAAGIIEREQGICAAKGLGGIRLAIAVGVGAVRVGAQGNFTLIGQAIAVEVAPVA